MDGVTVTNFEQNSGILFPLYTPSVEAVEEFTCRRQISVRSMVSREPP